MSHAVIHADALTYLRGNRWLVQNGYLPRAHAVLCDPPYGLAFMGKHWDTLGPVEFQVWVTEWAGLLIDYVYPGALGLFFGGTRTYHRLAAGLEDAGWEITDSMCVWVHAQGFPKSASIGKLLDKEAGAAREVVGVGTSGKNRNVLNAALHPETFGGPFALTAPATPLAARWEGYGTALKPAYEPIVIARAPRGKRTYAALAREFGTGALAIDAARIGVADGDVRSGGFSAGNRPWVTGSAGNTIKVDSTVGRWPSNFCLVCACEGDDHAANCPVITLGDAARFFYQAKAAAWERHWPVKSNHPTVKPIRLAEYLARLILPPELDTPRRLLVPFAGSGSEMIGARLAGWDVVTGIERESEYVALAEARLAWWAQFASYDDARAAYEKERKAKPALVVIEDKPEQIALFPADEEAS